MPVRSMTVVEYWPAGPATSKLEPYPFVDLAASAS
jgi:hypothetical protein